MLVKSGTQDSEAGNTIIRVAVKPPPLLSVPSDASSAESGVAPRPRVLPPRPPTSQPPAASSGSVNAPAAPPTAVPPTVSFKPGNSWVPAAPPRPTAPSTSVPPTADTPAGTIPTAKSRWAAISESVVSAESGASLLNRPDFMKIAADDPMKQLTDEQRRAMQLAARAALLMAPDVRPVQVQYHDPTLRTEKDWKAANPDRKLGELWQGPALRSNVSGTKNARDATEG